MSSGSRRPPWFGEAVIVAALLLVYDRIAQLADVRVSGAVAHGRLLHHIEDRLGLAVERPLIGILTPHHLLTDLAAIYYDFAHMWVTMAALVTAYLVAPAAYRGLRNALVAINLTALVVFLLYPVAPPRLLPGGGFADLVAGSHTWGSWESSDAGVGHADQYASMPSLHIAWAVWVVFAVVAVARARPFPGSRLAPAAAGTHLVLTVAIVLSTGQHYALDVLAGALVALVWALSFVTSSVAVPTGPAVGNAQAPDAVEPAEPAVLLVSASMGAGHDGVAYELAARLREKGARADVVDYLDVLPWGTGRVIKRSYSVQLRYAPATYEWLYSALDRNRVLEAIADSIAGWGRRRLLRMATKGGYTLTIATYPLAGQALGRLRREGRLDVPALTFLTDIDVHEMWLDAGTDLYLAVYEGSAAEVRRRTGRPAQAVGPMLPAHLLQPVTPAERAAARAALGIDPAGRPVALLVTGSWGVGAVAGTVAALADSGTARVVVLCGRNTALLEQLRSGGQCLALGWTDDVRSVLAAADVLIHNAGGLSSLEGFAVGVPVVGHGCLPGHGNRNAAAMRDAGVAALAGSAEELIESVRRLAGTAEGRALAQRARGLFVEDPTPQLLELMAGSQPAVMPVATRTRPGVPSTSRRARLALTACGIILAGPFLSYGVSQAAEHGIGVARAPRTGATVYAAALLDLREVRDPATAPLLRRYRLSAIVPGRIADADPSDVGRLRLAGASVLVAGSPSHALNVFSQRAELKTSLRFVRVATGERRPPVVLWSAPGGMSFALLDSLHAPVGLATTVLRPDGNGSVVGSDLERRDQAVLDLRGATRAQTEVAAASLQELAAASGLVIRPWGELWSLQ